ncbi:hypothetical protein LRB31_04665, partial [Borreliella burgdorferi]|nr:hypothetical protein [Borreliella burgdorferi]
KKIDESLKLLIASGYDASYPLSDNMNIGIGRICLLDKIVEAVMPKINDSDNDNFDDNICEKIKKVVDEFNKNEKDEYSCSIMSLNSYPKTKGKDLVKKCINELMKDVEKFGLLTIRHDQPIIKLKIKFFNFLVRTILLFWCLKIIL